MSEFENTQPQNEEIADTTPTRPIEKTVQSIPNEDTPTAPKPVNAGDITEIIKKYRKPLCILAGVIAVILIACSVFSPKDNEGKALFVDGMLVFNEINVENQAKMYGIIDKKGEIVADADFSLAYLVGDGMIVAQEPPAGEDMLVSNPASFGLVNKNGEEITKFSYSDSGIEFAEGLIPIAENDKWGFADKDAKWVIKPIFDGAHSFSEGMAGVKDAKSRKWGFTDKKGKLVIKAIFEDVGAFTDGIAPAKLDGKWGFVNKNGDWVIKNAYLDIDTFTDGMALAKDVNENWGFIDDKGKWVIKPRFQELNRFSDGVAAAKKNGKWGFIDKKGKWVIDNDYADVGNFVDGLAYAKEDANGKYGYIDKNSKWKIEPKYSFAYDFSMGLACVKIKDKYGYINKRGKTKIDFEYKYALPFYSDGFAPVCTGDNDTTENDKWFVINKKGASVFDKEDTFDGLMR